MRKKTIVMLFILSTVLGFGDIIVFIIASIIVLASCASNCGSFNPANIASRSLIDALLVSVTLLIAAIGEMLYMIAWIGSLVKQGKQQQWVWFAANLIAWFFGVGWIYMVVYLIAVPETPMSISSTSLPLQQPVQPYSAYPQYPPQHPYSSSPQYSSEPYSTYPQYPPRE